MERSQLRLIASPRTLLRWHADIVKRHCATPPPSRTPAVQRSARDCTGNGRDNPAWGTGASTANHRPRLGAGAAGGLEDPH